jgi:hypothetical protein
MSDLSDRINALPDWARQHIHDIETKCDPAGDIRTITELRDTIRALEARDANSELLAALQSACNHMRAAPELLNALKELAHQVQISNAIDDHGHALKNLKALHDAEAAIRKAKGEAFKG